MFLRKTRIKQLAIILTSGLLLAACEPSFETLTQQCSSTNPAILASELSADSSEFKIEAQRDNNEYKLYLEDALNSLANIRNTDSSELTSDQQAAIDYILKEANEKMGYVLVDEVVVSANNPLDYIESLIAATDPDEVIQIFVDIKETLAKTIKDQNSACVYSNDRIRLIVEDSSNDKQIVKSLDVQLNINFNPFDQADNRDVDQTLLITFNELIEEEIDQEQNEEDIEGDADTIVQRQERSFFSGINRIAAEDFEATGTSPPEVRQFNLNDDQTNETYFFDDDFEELNLGQIVSNHFNEICTLKDENGDEVEDSVGQTTQADCPAVDDNNEAIQTRAPIHPACKGNEELRTWLVGKCPINPSNDRQRHPQCPSDDSLSHETATAPDETNQIQTHNFTVAEGNDDLTDIQRFRVEVDYPVNEIRLYASKYADKISTAGTGLTESAITNPTACERQAVLDDLVYAERDNADFDGVRLTAIIDPKYDIEFKFDEDGDAVFDEDGNQAIENEPEAIYTFQGTAIPSRQ